MSMPEFDPSKWKVVDPNFRVPVDESQVVGFRKGVQRKGVSVEIVWRTLMGLLTFVGLVGLGVFGIANLVEATDIGIRDSYGIALILLFFRALDKVTFGKTSE